MLLSVQLEQNEYDLMMLLPKSQRLISLSRPCPTQLKGLRSSSLPTRSNTFSPFLLNNTPDKKQHLFTHAR